MVHMERETILGRLMGRRNGKTALEGNHTVGVIQNEIANQLAEAKAAVNAARTDRRRARRALELHRRRYEFPTGRRTGGATAPVACPHLRTVWWQVPHPRYGEAVPLFQSALRRVKAEHKCVAGVAA
jgi:mRNA-degrading endonuclease toxin of MazEF toxin-antitoxin module